MLKYYHRVQPVLHVSYETPLMFGMMENLHAYLQNLDGGGSSVSVENGKVISRPTCGDDSFICEREVSSIACIH